MSFHKQVKFKAVKVFKDPLVVDEEGVVGGTGICLEVSKSDHNPRPRYSFRVFSLREDGQEVPNGWHKPYIYWQEAEEESKLVEMDDSFKVLAQFVEEAEAWILADMRASQASAPPRKFNKHFDVAEERPSL